MTYQEVRKELISLLARPGTHTAGITLAEVISEKEYPIHHITDFDKLFFNKPEIVVLSRLMSCNPLKVCIGIQSKTANKIHVMPYNYTSNLYWKDRPDETIDGDRDHLKYWHCSYPADIEDYLIALTSKIYMKSKSKLEAHLGTELPVYNGCAIGLLYTNSNRYEGTGKHGWVWKPCGNLKSSSEKTFKLLTNLYDRINKQ